MGILIPPVEFLRIASPPGRLSRRVRRLAGFAVLRISVAGNTSGCLVGFGDGFSDPEVQGLATALMKMRATFEDAGWDFVTVWDIKEGLTYPFLRSLPDPFPEEPPVEPEKHAVDVSVPTLNGAGVVAFVFLTTMAMTWLMKRRRKI